MNAEFSLKIAAWIPFLVESVIYQWNLIRGKGLPSNVAVETVVEAMIHTINDPLTAINNELKLPEEQLRNLLTSLVKLQCK